MARPRRCRRICAEPAYDGFVPTGIGSREAVVLTVDEYEVIRLIDLEKLTHEQCAVQIGVARATVSDTYETAREKLADCLVHGKQLTISGGSYVLCGGGEHCLLGGCCERIPATVPAMPEKGEHSMRIAVTYENGAVFQHFGHTEAFQLFDVAGNSVTQRTVVSTNGSGHSALASLLKRLNVDTLICGGIGGGAQTALAEAGIRLCGGVSGSCEEAVAALLAGTLVSSGSPTCDHHGEGHHCGEHGCGEHDCGAHGCEHGGAHS